MKAFCIGGFILGIIAIFSGVFEVGIGFIAFCGLMWFLVVRVHDQVDNYDMSKVDTNKLLRDSGRPTGEIERNLISGKYNKDIK